MTCHQNPGPGDDSARIIKLQSEITLLSLSAVLIFRSVDCNFLILVVCFPHERKGNTSVILTQDLH
jgi:hypothetical protein